MQVSQFPCPQCGATLRTKGKVHIGKTLPCPDCGTLIELMMNEEQRVAAIIVESDINLNTEPDSPENSTPITQTTEPNAFLSWLHNLDHQSWRHAWQILASPVGIAWTVAGVALLLLMIAIWLDREPAPIKTTKPNLIAEQEVPPEAMPENPLLPQQKHADIPQQPTDTEIELALLDEPIMPEFSAERISENPVGAEPTADQPAVSIKKQNRPQRPPVKAPLPQKNVQRALELSIREFHQTRPIPLQDMLLQLQELAGVVIVVHLEKSDERLASKVKIVQDDTTIARILSAVLKPAGLIYQIRNGEIHVTSG